MAMITRAWLVISIAWAAFFLYADSTRVHPEVTGLDLLLAFFPLIAGVALKRIGRFVISGK